LDLPLSEVFYKWMLGGELTLQPDDLRHICPVFAKSFMQLSDILRQKKRIDSDKSHVRQFIHVLCFFNEEVDILPVTSQIACRLFCQVLAIGK